MAEESVKIKYELEDKSSTGMGKITAGIKSMLNPATLLAAGVAALGFSIGKMIGDAEESSKVMAQTEAVLKSTGGAAGQSAKSIAEHANALSRLTNFDDEAIQSGQNLLLTFTKIGGDVFPKATETMLDMSAALGQDMKSSATQLGKALNDPIQGISALSRVGVAFTEEQKKQIQVLVESGQTMEAQKIILKELSTEFGGSAKAIASPFTILKNTLGNVSEALGGKLLPFFRLGAIAITELANKFIDFVNAIDISGAVLNVKIGWERLRGETEKSLVIIKALITHPFSWDTYKALFQVLIERIGFAWDAIKIVMTGGFSAAKSIITKLFEDAAKETMTTSEKIQAINEKTQKNIVKIIQDSEKEKSKISDKSLVNHTEIEQAKVVASSRSFDQILAAHEASMKSKIANNTYTYEQEISGLNNILIKHAKTADEITKINIKLSDVRIAKNKEAGDSIIKNAEQEAARKKELGELSLQDQIATYTLLAENDLLNSEQKKKVLQDLFNFQTQLLVQEKAQKEFLFSEEQKQIQAIDEQKKKGMTLEMELGKIVLDAARDTANSKIALEKRIAQGALEKIKQRLIAEIDAISVAWAWEASGRIVGSWGTDIGAWGLLAASAVGASAARTTIDSIQLAEGGIVMPRPGGTQATIGEAGQAEAVIPLGSKMAQNMLGNSGGDKVIILDSDGVTTLAKAMWRKQKDLQRTGQLGSGL